MLYPFSRLCRPARSPARPLARSPASCGPALRRKRGFNLIESAVVLGVIGLVIGGIWIAASAVRFNRGVNGITTTVIKIAADIRAKGTQPYWTGPLVSGLGTPIDATDSLIAINIIPSDWVSSDGYTIRDPYFGKFTIAVSMRNSTQFNSMHIAIEDANYSPIDKALCMAIVSQLSQRLRNPAPVNLSVIRLSNAILMSGTQIIPLDSPTDVSTINTACASTITGLLVAVPW